MIIIFYIIIFILITLYFFKKNKKVNDNLNNLDENIKKIELLNKHKTVCLISRYFDNIKGGQEVWTYNYALFLLEQGYNVIVICNQYIETKNIIFLCYNYSKNSFSNAKRINKIIFKIKPYVCIFHDMGYTVNSDIFHLHYIVQNKNIFERILAFFTKKSTKNFFEFQIKTCKKLLLVSDYQKNMLLNQFDFIDPKKIIVVENGINLSHYFIEKKEEKEKKINLLFISGNHSLKNLNLILKSLLLLKKFNKSFNLIIIGNKLSFFHKFFIIYNDLSKNISFIGKTTNVKKYYKICDILLLPSFSESFGLVILEALACNKPVIISKNTGLSEYVINGQHGYVLNDLYNPKELFECILKLEKWDKNNLCRELALKFNYLDKYKQIIKEYKLD
jgi:glycosyltransferase involved in cell wall biosynthesis